MVVLGRKFIKYLQSQFRLDTVSKKLQNWYELEFGGFITELNKTINKHNKEVATATTREHAPLAKLTKINEMEWMEVFATKKAEAQTLKTQIDKTDKEIDQMVYGLYALSEEEIKIMEEN